MTPADFFFPPFPCLLEREGALEPVRRHSAGSKYIPGIIDEDVDARLFCRDPVANQLGLVETGQVGDMGLVFYTRCDFAQPPEGAFCPPLVAGDNDHPRALRRKPLGRDPPDA